MTPELSPSPAPSNRSAGAADRARQRRNKERREGKRGGEIELTPRQIQRMQEQAGATTTAAAVSDDSSEVADGGKSGGSLNREQVENVAVAAPLPLPAPVPSTTGFFEPVVTNPYNNIRRGSSHQEIPTDEDLEDVQWVKREGGPVPRLASTQTLTVGMVSEMNGIQAAHAFEKQGPGFFPELFENLQKNDGVAWRRCMQAMAKLMDDEKVKFEDAREKSSTVEKEAHSYMVPEDTEMDDNESSGDEEFDEDFEWESHLTSSETATPLPDKPTMPQNRDLIMNELTVQAQYQSGRRADSLQRSLKVTADVTEARNYRFSKLSNAKVTSKKDVNQFREEEPQPNGYRSYATLRKAFDHVAAHLDGPKHQWKSSSQWFLATMNIINSDPALCDLVFEYNTHYFLADLRKAMVKADETRSTDLLEKRTVEEYADLLGYGKERAFDDEFIWF